MLKAKATLENGDPLLIFGLDHENLRRLKQGEPIKFFLSDVGMGPGAVIIMAGETTDDIAMDLGIPLQ